MARKSKWIEIQSPQDPVVVIARRALSERLQLVWRYLERASHGSPADTENVHQLRVSTRRAVAALENFAQLLPKRRSRWMTRQLKRVRRAAGTARDVDVMLSRFLPLAEAEEGEDAYGLLVHSLRVGRQRAQDEIDDVHEKLARKRFTRRIKTLVKKTRLRSKQDRFDEPSIAAAAHTALQHRVAEFFTAAEADFADYAHLHAFRIQAKQLRYAIEIFASACDPALRETIYPQVAALQEKLGQINDHVVAAEFFGNWLSAADDRLQPLIEQIVAEEQSAQESSREEFFAWWTDERRQEVQELFARCGLQEPSEDFTTDFAVRRAE